MQLNSKLSIDNLEACLQVGINGCDKLLIIMENAVKTSMLNHLELILKD